MVKVSGILDLTKIFTKPALNTVRIPFKPVTEPVKKITNFVEKASANKIPFTYPEKSAFYSYPEKLQKEILDFGQKLSDAGQTKALAFIEDLGKFNTNSQLVEKLIKNPKDFLLYTLSKTNFNKLQPNIEGSLAETARQNLALMAVYNPKGLKELAKSKGYKEILNGNLNIIFLKAIKPNAKFDADYFYKFFDLFEKSVTQVLAKIKGLDVDAAGIYIKSFDNEICKQPYLLDNLVKELNNVKNKELLNKILKKFNSYKDSGMQIRNFIKVADKNPKTAEKIIEMENLHPGNAIYILKGLPEKSRMMSDEMLDYLVKYQKKNPDVFKPYMLNAAECFLLASKNDEKLLKKLLEIATKDKTIDIDIENVMYSTRAYNLDYLKRNIEHGKLDEEFIDKFKITAMNSDKFNTPESLPLVDKIYEETYLPLKNLFKDKKDLTFSEKYLAERLTDMKINNPDIYKNLEDLSVIDFIKQGKINPRIINGLRKGRELTPKVIEDLKMLKSGESIIKKFDNFDKILSKTKSGDVVSVKEQLYLNNNGKLERWNMTEEKFNELFPLVDRWTTQQGAEDCYLISALDTIYRNPKTRAKYYKMFEQKGNDICVTIPAYKDFKGEVKFPNGEIKTITMNADSAKHIQMVERAYARTALRNQNTTPVGQDPLTTDDLVYLADRNRSGHSSDVMQEILGFNRGAKKYNHKGEVITYSVDNKCNETDIHNFFLRKGTNPDKVIFNIGLLKPGQNSGHAMELKSYNPQDKTFTLIDPMLCASQETFPLDKLSKELFCIWETKL